MSFRKFAQGVVLVSIATAVIASTAAYAARPSKRDPSCSVSPNSAGVGQTYVVSAWGLPTGIAVNVWVTDPGGNTSGSPLGSTGDGTFALNESSGSAGTWKYTFSGPTKNNPATTAVYASCSVDVY